MKGINFNQRPTPVARGSSRATCENFTERMWELVSTVSVPSGFSDLIVLRVCCNSSVPSRAFVMCSPLELIIMPLLGDDFSHLLPLPAARPRCPVPPVVEGWHSGDSLYYPIQWVESKDGTTWELIQGFGILVHPFPPGGSLSSTNLLYRQDFLWSVRSRLGLSSDGVGGY